MAEDAEADGGADAAASATDAGAVHIDIEDAIDSNTNARRQTQDAACTRKSKARATVTVTARVAAHSAVSYRGSAAPPDLRPLSHWARRFGPYPRLPAPLPSSPIWSSRAGNRCLCTPANPLLVHMPLCC